MNIRQLEYFVRIYECGSLFKAADSLFVSQQALSRALVTLEQELNATLFYRNHKGVTPTTFGEELYVSCQPALREMRALEKHMNEFIRQNYGHLKIGLGAGCRYFISKTIWRDFFKDYPFVSYDIGEYTYKRSLELLSSKELDILIISDYLPGKDYYQSELNTQERVLLLPKEHPAFESRYAVPEILRKESFVLSINDLAFNSFTEFCDKNNCRPKEILRVSDTLYMYETCSRDRCAGITIKGYFTDVFLPKFPDLDIIPFEQNMFPYIITLMARFNHPNLSLIMSLASYLKEYLSDKS